MVVEEICLCVYHITYNEFKYYDVQLVSVHVQNTHRRIIAEAALFLVDSGRGFRNTDGRKIRTQQGQTLLGQLGHFGRL